MHRGFDECFRLSLPHGLVLGVRLPDVDEAPADVLALLHREEAALADGFARRRQITFAGGRLALRRALEALGVSAGPALATARGAPRLPSGVKGSVSHTDTHAVALVKSGEPGALGVDVENVAPPKEDISATVLTAREHARWVELPEPARVFELMARFSLKEALYKALDPYVSRLVGFEEIELELGDGTAQATPRLEGHEGPFEVELNWYRPDGLMLSTACVRRPGGGLAR